MSADNLMARVNEARDRLREARGEALAATGALKGIYMQRTQITNLLLNTLLKPSPLPSLEERMQSRANSSSPSNFRADIAAGRINEKVWQGHLERRAEFEGGRVITEAAWKDPTTGKNMTFNGVQSRRLDFVYRYPNGKTDAVETKKSSLTAASRTAEAQRARDQIAMNQGAQIGKKEVGFYSDVDNVVYKKGLPLFGPGGNTDLPGAGERETHVHIEPQDGKTFLRQALRGGSKALGPLGAAVDAYYLADAIAEDGGTFGENTKTTVGGIAGGWGGAAAGAALGTVLIPVPVVGTVVGGIIGGIAGGIAGERLGDLL